MHSWIVLRLRKGAGPFALTSLALALVAAIGYRFQLNAAVVVLLCLLITVLHALTAGFLSSAIVSIMAGACLVYFFFPPIFSFRIDDPLDVLALFVFLVIANGVAWVVSKAHEALRNTQRQLALAQSTAHLGLWSYDPRTKEIVASEEYLRLYGLRADESPLTRQRWLGLIHPDDRERMERLIWQDLAQPHFWDTEFRVVWPDGSVHWLLGKGTLLLDNLGRPVRVTGLSLDITERKAALRESEERFRNMADAAPVGIWTSGPDGLLSFCNERALSFAGRTMEQMIGTGGFELIHPEDRERLQSAFASAFNDRSRCEIEHRLRRADGVYRWMLCCGVPRFDVGGVCCGYIGSLTDITDLKGANDEALSHRKLESMGRLASGIAHDFNNLLGGILAGAELALEERANSSRVGEELKRIQLASIRGAEIVRQLMLFGGQESAAFELVDASLLVREMIELLKVSISKHVILHAKLPRDLPKVRANPAQLRQVVMNLVTNASEAIGEREGVIRIGIAQVARGPDSHPAGAPNLPQGDYLQIEVSDTGSGMTADVQSRVFDPFYTTKLAGRGLGLSVTQGIIRGHDGSIHVVSEPGHGTTFQILLPYLKGSVEETANPISLNRAQRSTASIGTILVVEDNESLRRATSRMLRLRGFSVIAASDGSAAIDAIRAHKDDIDTILLDLTLPGIASREVFVEAKRLRPELKVILTSAYGKEAVNDASFPGLQVEHFIRKPYQLDDLESLLRET
jgi:two-component system, cell cycle sensor histidine kinase and response regulator CckA